MIVSCSIFNKYDFIINKDYNSSSFHIKINNIQCITRMFAYNINECQPMRCNIHTRTMYHIRVFVCSTLYTKATQFNELKPLNHFFNIMRFALPLNST